MNKGLTLSQPCCMSTFIDVWNNIISKTCNSVTGSYCNSLLLYLFCPKCRPYCEEYNMGEERGGGSLLRAKKESLPHTLHGFTVVVQTKFYKLNQCPFSTDFLSYCVNVYAYLTSKIWNKNKPFLQKLKIFEGLENSQWTPSQKYTVCGCLTTKNKFALPGQSANYFTSLGFNLEKACE